jgi:hypothetical protein
MRRVGCTKKNYVRKLLKVHHSFPAKTVVEWRNFFFHWIAEKILTDEKQSEKALPVNW